MNYKEASPLPAACRGCKEADCYNCDTAGLRWVADPVDELRARKKLKQRAIERLQREIAEIDRRLQGAGQ